MSETLKEVTINKNEKCNACNMVRIPVLNIPMLSDERWNQIAYQQMLERGLR